MNSKIFLILGLVGAATLAASTSASAQEIIYSDSLTSPDGVLLNGTSPSIDTTSSTWTADSAIERTATGTTFGNGDSAYLPFAPVLGDDYTLTLQIDSTAGTNGIGVGFTRFDTTNNQFYGDGQESWMYLSGPANDGTSTVQYFNPGDDYTVSGTFTPPVTFSINLQTTTSGNWTETYFVNGTQVGQLSDLPEQVNYIGFGDLNTSNASGAGLIESIKLVNNSATPEPSTWAMMLLGSLLVFACRRTLARV